MPFIVNAFPTFQPAVRIISAITNSNPAVVTTTFDISQPNQGNQYVDGMVIRLDVPRSYGMTEINTLFAPITVIDDDNFSIAIDSTRFTPFTVPSPQKQYAQCVPIADKDDNTFPAAVQNVLPYKAI